MAGEIAGPVWPKDYPMAELLRTKPDEGQRQLEQYIGDFFRAFLTDYRAVVEENFPSLKTAFALYSDLPVRLYIEVTPVLNRHQIEGRLALLGERLPAGSANEVIVCSKGELDGEAQTYRGQSINAFWHFGTRLERYIPWKQGGQPLHDYLYTSLTSEWAKVEDVIRGDNGLTAKRPH